MIVFQEVVKSYGSGVNALDGVSIQIPERDFVFLVGSSGAGKTTVIRLINCDQRPTSGAIFVDGINTGRLGRKDTPMFRRKIGVVHQDFKLLADRTVEENIAFALRVVDDYGLNSKERIHEALETVGLDRRSNSYPEQLSGGERQRVAVARCLVTNPAIVVADEPTGNLDPDSGRETMNLLVRINAAGTTVIVATHNQALVDTMQRRVIALENGQVMRDERAGGYVGG